MRFLLVGRQWLRVTGYGTPELPVHMNGRIYDPLLGRFLSADLVVSNPGDLQEFNRYSYVKNRPLTLTDPSGFAPADALSDRAFLRGATAAYGAEKADTMLHQKIAAEGKGAATGAFLFATAGAGPVVAAAAAEGNVAAQLLLAGLAAKGLGDGTVAVAEGSAELIDNPKSAGGWIKTVGGLLDAGMALLGVRDTRKMLADAPVTSSTAASTRTTNAADSADTPAPATEPVNTNKPAAAPAPEISPTPPTARLKQDIAVDPTPPVAKPLDRPIGSSPTQNARLQADIAEAKANGATDFRVNQQQVNAAGERVGTNRPDLQYTDANGQRVYREYDTTKSTRGSAHQKRIKANDPNGRVELITQD